MTSKQKTVCFVAGKSGGHILPCLTLASSFAKIVSQGSPASADRSTDKQDNPECSILFFSTDAVLDRSILGNQSIISDLITLPLGRFSKLSVYRHAQIIWRLIHSFIKSLYHLYHHKPTTVISTGGLIALPVCLAAWLLRIPIELYELNAVPGKAIKLLAPLAHNIYVCFAQAVKHFPTYACTYKPYPVRFTSSHKQMTQKQAIKELGLYPNKKTLFIMGGSQGSVQLNNAIKNYIETSSHINNLQIIHQTGAHDLTDWQTLYAHKNIPAVVFAYRDAIAPCYVAADLIISRAGAGMLFELLFFEKQSIIIPLEAKTTSHQLDNAYAMMQEHPALFTVIRQEELLKHNTLLHHLNAFLETAQLSTKEFCAQKNPAQSEA